MKRFLQAMAFAIAAVTVSPAFSQSEEVLTRIKKNDYINCGVHTDLPGFSSFSTGTWKGIDVDMCRSVAAAVLGDANKVKYVPLTVSQRFVSLQTDQIDILSRNVTLGFTRDTQLGLSNTIFNYYDAFGFLVNTKGKKISLDKLNGLTICTLTGSSLIQPTTDWLKTRKMTASFVYFENLEILIKALKMGRCNAYTNDISQLAIIKKVHLDNNFVIMPDVIIKSPLGPMVKSGNEQLRKTIAWVYYAQVTAEELGVNSKNVDSMASTSVVPDVQLLLGNKNPKFGSGLDLDAKWAYRVISQVGNLEEIYENNMGKNSSINLPRGTNNLWNKGGLHYAPLIH